jgi:adenylyl-sulfate kinase
VAEGRSVNGLCVWLTGLSGAGKTTLARATAATLGRQGWQVEVLDGDDLRRTLCADLGFSREDRTENIRRIIVRANELVERGIVVLVAAITPYEELRRAARGVIENYLEVWVNAPLEVCSARDPKTLYAKARRGEIANFTGVSDVYESPQNADLMLRTDHLPVEACVRKIAAQVVRRLAAPN